MKLTDWIPGNVKPVRVGVYQIRPPGWIGDVYAYWNGQWWGDFARNPAWAEWFKTLRNDTQRMEWRGLAEKPE